MNATIHNPEMSVLMAVFNGEDYVLETIESILTQSFTNFEFLIIDDASSDKSLVLIEAAATTDHRIRVYKNERNIGLAASLNKGIKLADSSLIARMDADDIAEPSRLQKQFDFMLSHPKISVCGTYMRAYEKAVNLPLLPEMHEEIKTLMLFQNPIFHPTVVFRKESIKKNNGYDESFTCAQDYELWERLSHLSEIRFANIPEPLLIYRTHIGKSRPKYKIKQKQLTLSICLRQLSRLGLEPSEHERELHSKISTNEIEENKAFLEDCHKWLMKIKAANLSFQIYTNEILEQELAKVWWRVCKSATGIGMDSWRLFWMSPLAKIAPISKRQKIIFLIRCGMRYSKKFDLFILDFKRLIFFKLSK